MILYIFFRWTKVHFYCFGWLPYIHDICTRRFDDFMSYTEEGDGFDDFSLLDNNRVVVGK